MPTRRLLGTLLAVLALSVILAACGGSGTRQQTTETSAGEQADLEHIHGLGVDPRTGTLYVATHFGLFQAARGESRLKRIGTSRQDIMGFSVVAPGRFIGSGHPAPEQSDLPPNLGLIESRDSGRSWKGISLSGKADFHVLQSAGPRVYGFDGTQARLMVSSNDGNSWRQQAPPGGMFSLAIDPTDADRIVASTDRGVFSSSSAGKSWEPRSRELAGLLAWPKPHQLLLVDGQGQVQLSTDNGDDWSVVGGVGGQPGAFISAGDDLYVALGDGTVHQSTDGGRSWDVRATP